MRPLFQSAIGFTAGSAACMAGIVGALFGLKPNFGGWVAVFLVSYITFFTMIRNGWHHMMLSLAIGVAAVTLVNTIILHLP